MTPQAPPARQADLDLAERLAREVAPLAMRWFSSVDLTVVTKDDGSPVTQADLTIESRLRELLVEADPLAVIVGEETGQIGESHEEEVSRRWFIDPIDGTTAFVHGVPLFSTLLTLHDEHGPAIGVISLPALDEIVIAGRDSGAMLNGKPCSVSTTSQLDQAIVTTWAYQEWPLWLIDELQRGGAELRGWSDGFGWALVATGRADVVVEIDPKPWDIAPMQVIIPEAGGRFSTLTGADSIDGDSVIGTNGHLHGTMLDLVRPHLD